MVAAWTLAIAKSNEIFSKGSLKMLRAEDYIIVVILRRRASGLMEERK